MSTPAEPKEVEKTDGVEDVRPKRPNNGWTKELEHLVADWSDRAQCYRWMHDKTSRAYGSYNQYMMIPVIILSTLTGTANFGMDSFFTDPGVKKIAVLGVGGVSIVTGIISTLANFLRYAQGSEAHSGAAISWAKFSRLISIELALHPNERMEAFAFLKMFRIELDRLIEQSPPIPEETVRKFKIEFRTFTDIKRPDITGYIEHTQAYNNNSERMKQLAVEATLTLLHKKNLLKELVLNDLDSKVRDITTETIKQVQAASAAASKKSAGTAMPFAKRVVEERKQELSQLPIGLVADIKNRIRGRGGRGAEEVVVESEDVVIDVSGGPVALAVDISGSDLGANVTLQVNELVNKV
uniref:SLATT domain-containing protein n=1 Tax=viral metagenome TaxID=1070528 RepID=A0A6C0KY78_9ZZZZ